ncbi:MAG: NAD(P)H-dependent oxidoreductase subunit E [Gammaproteobacteria bacterium]
MKLPLATIYEAATFYHHFDVIPEGETPPPELTVRVCESVTCEMFGCDHLVYELKQHLEPGVRVQRVPCVGRCHGAPVAVVGINPIEKATPQAVLQAVQSGDSSPENTKHIDYQRYRKQGGYQTLRACIAGERNVEEVVTVKDCTVTVPRAYIIQKTKKTILL